MNEFMLQKFRIKNEVAWRKTEDETVVVVSPITEEIYTLNKTAGIVWEMFETGETVKNVLNSFQQLFKDDKNLNLSVLKEDVVEIIEDFVERKLLENV